MSASRKTKMTHIQGGAPVIEGVIGSPVLKPPNAPRNLDDMGQKYWREYTRAMIDSLCLFETDLATLEDLCYWESLKHRGRDELPQCLYMEYKDSETGELSHTQPHAAFSNLKAIQSTIIQLRGKLGLTLSDRSGLRVIRRTTRRVSALQDKQNW